MHYALLVMKRPQSTQGYTLFEMAVVVVIMGTMAAMVAPGVGEYMADTRASSAAEELLRINRVMRARVNQTGLAHLMMFQSTNDAAGSNGLGRIRVWEGMNNHCNQTPWLQTINGTIENGHRPIDVLDLGDSAYNLASDGRAPSASDTNRQVVRIQPTPNATLVVLCFEPGGNTFVGASATNSPAIGFRFTIQTQPVMFSVIRSVVTGGVVKPRGVTRDVLFPAGGNGRMRF